ncbi:ribose-phosphate pyrophosphokinase 5 [Pseudomassariella vexata]|uniref:Ribose-phosphate pyrophosphokinase 5 n=1 Tax=Pseudomassariella vexata TaxID=1141098 RepID=A0A1Y2DPU4_9PEZI|nr:ribose-phosphate pyrophosphokinase 5 [Pseudomassariella vexata]ORY61280.1 ribose-phosphate pyrophosphokinase 5 [Pseudomassariella vexata]
MVRGIVVLAGNSHPQLAEDICNFLGIAPSNRILTKFSAGESRCEIQDSVRGKDVFIIQTGGGAANDHFVDACVMISACKTGSAKRVTVVTPLFPYSRQPDLPYKKTGSPLSRTVPKDKYTFESVPPTPGPGIPKSAGLSNGTDLSRMLSKTVLGIPRTNGDLGDTTGTNSIQHSRSTTSETANFTTHDYVNVDPSVVNTFEAKPGYKRWVAQAGTLVADLLTCAGADHVVALDLHDAQYQGFFDIPMDNLYGRPLLKKYIQKNIPDYKNAVIVSPDAGGAKRATAIADSLEMDFALIHKERRPVKITDRQNATMMLVGEVKNRVCILIDDLADTANTITRAAKLLKREGAAAIYCLLSHGIFSGDALTRINVSAIDKIIVTNSVPQERNQVICSKLQVLDVAPIFAEAIRRIHHGESLSSLFQHG